LKNRRRDHDVAELNEFLSRLNAGKEAIHRGDVRRHIDGDARLSRR
jgi:hypothetical protein